MSGVGAVVWFLSGAALGIVVTGAIGVAHQEVVVKPQREQARALAQQIDVQVLELQGGLRTALADQQKHLVVSVNLARELVESRAIAEAWRQRWLRLDDRAALDRTYFRHLHAAGRVPVTEHLLRVEGESAVSGLR